MMQTIKWPVEYQNFYGTALETISKLMKLPNKIQNQNELHPMRFIIELLNIWNYIKNKRRNYRVLSSTRREISISLSLFHSIPRVPAELAPS
jgi:hypothetical protein